MSWKLVIASPAARTLRRTPPEDRSRLKAALQEMCSDPFAGDVKWLAGTNGALRRRVGAWRIIFDLEKPRRLVIVIAIIRRGSKTY